MHKLTVTSLVLYLCLSSGVVAAAPTLTCTFAYWVYGNLLGDCHR